MPDNMKRLQRYDGATWAPVEYGSLEDRLCWVPAEDVAPLEEEVAELRAENARLRDGIDKDRHAYLMAGWRYEKLVQAESQHARLVALLRRIKPFIGDGDAEDAVAALLAENERLRIVDEETGGGHKTYEELAIEGAGLKSQHARLVALLRDMWRHGAMSTRSDYGGLLDHVAALLAEIDGGGA